MLAWVGTRVEEGRKSHSSQRTHPHEGQKGREDLADHWIFPEVLWELWPACLLRTGKVPESQPPLFSLSYQAGAQTLWQTKWCAPGAAAMETVLIVKLKQFFHTDCPILTVICLNKTRKGGWELEGGVYARKWKGVAAEPVLVVVLAIKRVQLLVCYLCVCNF